MSLVDRKRPPGRSAAAASNTRRIAVPGKPGDAVDLRQAVPEDYRYCERLYLETMRPLLLALNAWDERDLLARFASNFSPGEAWLIRFDGVDVGWLQVARTEAAIILVQIHIERGLRSRGIGTALIGELFDEGNTKHLPVLLEVVRNNPAITLYTRLGFTVVSQDQVKLYMRRHPGEHPHLSPAPPGTQPAQSSPSRTSRRPDCP